MLRIALLISFLLGTQVFAGEDPKTFAVRQAKEVQKEADSLIAQGNLFGEKVPKNTCRSQLIGNKETKQSLKGCRKHSQRAPEPKTFESRTFVFVSFSMPEVSLKALAQEAEKHNAVVVMRGLYQDSFTKTAQKLKDLEIAVDIHPELFEIHQITSVPTFVQIKDNKPLHRLSGNVSLAFCTAKFQEAS